MCTDANQVGGVAGAVRNSQRSVLPPLTPADLMSDSPSAPYDPTSSDIMRAFGNLRLQIPSDYRNSENIEDWRGGKQPNLSLTERLMMELGSKKPDRPEEFLSNLDLLEKLSIKQNPAPEIVNPALHRSFMDSVDFYIRDLERDREAIPWSAESYGQIDAPWPDL